MKIELVELSMYLFSLSLSKCLPAVIRCIRSETFAVL